METGEMLSTYKEIEELLQRLDFDKLWKGFTPFPFALYGGKNAVYGGKIIDRPPNFVGNTSVTYQDKLIAIWNIEESYIADCRKLTSKIVHEMFHAEQMLNNDSRWANEFYGIKYDFDLTNLSLKAEENRLLALGLVDKMLRHEVLEKVIASRRYRKERFPQQFDYEMRTETMEGAAQYVESRALKLLSCELYDNMIDTICSHLNDYGYIINVRYGCYDSGTAFLLLADSCEVAIPCEFSRKETLFDLVSQSFPPIPFTPCETSAEVSAVVEKLMAERNETLENALKWKCVNLQAEVIGFDPLNTFFHKGYMYAKCLSVLKIEEKEEYLCCEQLIPLDDFPKVTKIYKKEE